MPKRAVFERSRRELSLDVSVGVHILLVVEQSSLGSQSRGWGCAKTPILTVLYCNRSRLVTYGRSCLRKNRNVSRPSSDHPPVRGEMSKRLGGIIGCKDKTSSWHFIGLYSRMAV